MSETEVKVAKKLQKVVSEKKQASDVWEIKDRTYKLKNGLTPITATIKSRGIYWFDQEKGYEREIKYTENQRTPFVDEFKGTAKLAHITFKDGDLFVPKEKQILQKILSLYHPDLDKKYYEVDRVKIAENDLEQIDLEFEAMSIARELDVDAAEAILRVDMGSKVRDLTSNEVKRDIRIFARNNPELFLELANDENVGTRNVGVKAVEQGIIKLSDDQRSFKWGTNDRLLMTVPFDENPYSALAAWFKTDEGVEVFKSVEKKLK